MESLKEMNGWNPDINQKSEEEGKNHRSVDENLLPKGTLPNPELSI